MITEILLNMIKLPLLGLLKLLPVINITIPSGIQDWFTGAVQSVAFLLPVGDILIMMGVTLALVNFKFIWRLVTKLWSMLPFT